MYFDFYHFARPPFANTTDPPFFFASAAHREALATLAYGIQERKGLVVLTGPVGNGKTMLLRKLLADHAQYHAVFLANPWLSPAELFTLLWQAWGNKSREAEQEVLSELQQSVAAQSAVDAEVRFVLIADEAHLLTEDTLEAVRLLLNLEDERGKLVQILLSGQVELASTLRQHRMRPLLQRVALVEHLQPFDLDDTIGYIQHRLRVAGGDPYLFPLHCVELIHQYSRGLPRLINQICDHSLIFAFGRQSRTVERQDIEAALGKLPLGSSFLAPEAAEETETENSTSRQEQKPATSPSVEVDTTSSSPSSPSVAKAFSSAAADEERALAKSTNDLTKPSSEVPDVAAMAFFDATSDAKSDTKATGATVVDSETIASPSPMIRLERAPIKWSLIILSVLIPLAIGIGLTYWWMSQQVNPALNDANTHSPQRTSPLSLETLPSLRTDNTLSSHSLSPTESPLSRPFTESTETALPLPAARQALDIRVESTKDILALLSQHFGVDNTTVRDLVLASNPGIDLEALVPGSHIKIPSLQRQDMIVTDSRGRFYIYFATLTDGQEINALQQRLSLLGTGILKFQVKVGGRTAERIFLGYFPSFEAAHRVLEILRFSYLPMLEQGEQKKIGF